MRQRDPSTEQGFIPGSQIGLESDLRPITVTQAGRASCLLGYQSEKTARSDLPYYHPRVALREPQGLSSSRFVYLERGMLYASTYFRPDWLYRLVEDRWLVLPSGAQSYFGIISTDGEREEDEGLTRQIFGATHTELSEATTAWGRVMGWHELVLPRVTFSKTRENACDLTGALIPREFPYITFGHAQSRWSHVSFVGFYRLVSLTCGGRAESAMGRGLVNEGLQEELVERLVEYGYSMETPL